MSAVIPLKRTSMRLLAHRILAPNTEALKVSEMDLPASVLHGEMRVLNAADNRQAPGMKSASV